LILEINMRSEKTIPSYGTHRTVSKFLWTPLTIRANQNNGDVKYVRRWLETAKWEEKWAKGRTIDFWMKVRWLDLET